MDYSSVDIATQKIRIAKQESAARNELFVEECLKQIHTAPDAEEGLRSLLKHLGNSLECERVYVFEEMDRQHIRNTYEWCKKGIPSGIRQLPYLAKKDLFPWYGRLAKGENVIEPDVTALRESEPLIYEFLEPQQIRSIVLSPLLTDGKMAGLLGADNPDAIVLAIDLPDGNGINFCRNLNGSIPTVFLTARSNKQAVRDGMQAGGCTFLTKPYQLNDLHEAVEKAVQIRRNRQ